MIDAWVEYVCWILVVHVFAYVNGLYDMILVMSMMWLCVRAISVHVYATRFECLVLIETLCASMMWWWLLCGYGTLLTYWCLMKGQCKEWYDAQIFQWPCDVLILMDVIWWMCMCVHVCDWKKVWMRWMIKVMEEFL